MKCLEPKQYEKHLQRDQNRIRTYQQKRKPEKNQKHTEEKPNNEVFGCKQSLYRSISKAAICTSS